MKIINIVLLCLISATICAATFAAPLSINGVWTNSYGSIMRLNNQQGTLTGCYSSKTGSTGAYPLAGFIDVKPNAGSKGTTIAFAIPWRSYLGGKGDTSWHWASTMSGIFYIDKQEKLELLNSLYMTTKFSGINTELGLFPLSLTFTRYPDQNWQCPKPKVAEQNLKNEILFGTWKNANNTLILTKNSMPGLVTGYYNSGGGQNYSVVGYYDYDPKTPLPEAENTSIALIISNESSRQENKNSQLALIGILNSKQKILDLYSFKTFAIVNYSANKLGHEVFVKVQM